MKLLRNLFASAGRLGWLVAGTGALCVSAASVAPTDAPKVE